MIDRISIVDLALGQHGLITRKQAMAAGYSRNQIKERLTRGTWLVAERGIYRLASHPDSCSTGVLAATLSTGGVASHRTAGVLWGLDVADGGLPRPELEYLVRGPDGFAADLDLAYPDPLIGIELDSATWHLNRRSFEHDPRRRNQLQNLGWSILTFTWSDYIERSRELIATVRIALERSDEWGRVRAMIVLYHNPN